MTPIAHIGSGMQNDEIPRACYPTCFVGYQSLGTARYLPGLGNVNKTTKTMTTEHRLRSQFHDRLLSSVK
jgi:hypothetical protein